MVATVPVEWQVIGSGDFDGDGKADLLWRNTTTGDTVASLMNGPSIKSSTLLASLSLDWKIIGIGDFNGDGRADLLWQHPSTADYVVSLIDGAAIMSSTLIANVADWSVVGIGDFDGDGKKDILWYNAPTDRLVISFMNGAAISTSVATTMTANSRNPPTPQIQVGDFDGDGKDDVVIDTFHGGVVNFMDGANIRGTTGNASGYGLDLWIAPLSE